MNGAASGHSLVRASWAGTGVLAAGAVAALLWEPAETVVVAASLLLFSGGGAAFVAAYLAAVRRSRADEITVATLYFLTGSTAPASVRRALFSAVAAQVVVALAAALARPFSALAFTVLAPLWGLGLAGLWGSRHGRFPPRRVTTPRSGR